LCLGGEYSEKKEADMEFELKIGTPKYFTGGRVLIVLLALYVLSILVGAVLIEASVPWLLMRYDLSVWGACLYLAYFFFLVFAAVGWLLSRVVRVEPLYYRWVFRRLLARTEPDLNLVAVSLRGVPAVGRGIRKSLDDADDLGFLSFWKDGLTFRGDSIAVTLPYSNIVEVSFRTSGLRAFWSSDAWVRLHLNGGGGIQALDIAEGWSLSWPQARERNRGLAAKLQRRIVHGG
jgi:hypothetical protein